MIFDNGKAEDVGTEPVRIFELTNRHQSLWIRNLGPVEITIGGEGIQIDNGVWLPPKAQLPIDGELPKELWAVSDTEAQVVVAAFIEY